MSWWYWFFYLSGMKHLIQKLQITLSLIMPTKANKNSNTVKWFYLLLLFQNVMYSWSGAFTVPLVPLNNSFLKTNVPILVFLLQVMSVFDIWVVTECLTNVRSAVTVVTHLAWLPENKYVFVLYLICSYNQINQELFCRKDWPFIHAIAVWDM